MTSFIKIIQYGALTYCIISIVQAILVGASFDLHVDNYLFIFGLVNMFLVAFNNKRMRPLLGAFLLFFSWTLAIEFYNKEMTFISDLPSLLYFLKWPVIVFTLMDFVNRSNKPERLLSIVDGLFFVLLVLNLFMLVNPWGFGEDLQLLFQPKPFTVFANYSEPGVFRLSGTQMNPNDNALLFCLFFIYYLMRGKTKWAFTSLCIGVLILTQSRTVFIASVLVGGVHLIRSLGILKNKNRALVLLGISVFSIGTLILSSRNLRSLFTGEAWSSGSLSTRINNFTNVFEGTTMEKILGNGLINNPLEVFGKYIDSELVAIVLFYGIVGLLLWLVIIILIIVHFPRYSTRRKYWIFIALLIIISSLTNYTFLHGANGVAIASFLGLVGLFDSKNERVIQQKDQ